MAHATERRVGVEIEFVGATREDVANAIEDAGVDCNVEEYNHTRRRAWKIVHDGSLSGPVGTGELVSPPTTNVDEIERVLRAAASAGATVNRTCGLHVHVDMQGATISTWRRLFKLWCRYEDALFSVLPSSRRSNTYCMKIAPLFRGAYDPGMSRIFDRIEALGTLRELTDNVMAQSRYYALNPQANWRHGTVEFRLHSGSVNASKVRRWIRLCQTIVAMAFDETFAIAPSAASLAQLFDDMQRFYGAQPASAAPVAAEVASYRPRGNGPVAVAWQLYREVVGDLRFNSSRDQEAVRLRVLYLERAAALGVNRNTAWTSFNRFLRAANGGSARAVRTVATAAVDVADLRSFYLERAAEFGGA